MILFLIQLMFMAAWPWTVEPATPPPETSAARWPRINASSAKAAPAKGVGSLSSNFRG